MHQVQGLEGWVGRRECGGKDREILCDIVGDTEGRKRPTRHQKLFANVDNFNEFSWIG